MMSWIRNKTILKIDISKLEKKVLEFVFEIENQESQANNIDWRSLWIYQFEINSLKILLDWISDNLPRCLND